MQILHWVVSLGILGLSTSIMAADEDKGPGQSALENLDTNDDGVVSFVEFQEGDRDRLAEIDSDQNGVLTIDEFLNARPAGGPRFGNRGTRGGGGDGASQIDEERRAEMREMMAQRATERFNEMDTDGDKIVSVAEFQEANFNQMDRDGDGVLTAQELRRPGRGGRGGRGPSRRGRPGGQRGGQSPQA